MIGTCRAIGSGQAGVSPLLHSCGGVNGRGLGGGRQGTTLSYWEERLREREKITMFVLVRARIRVIGTRKGILCGTSGLVV